MRMETGTFLQENIREYMNKYFIPLKYESGKDAEQFLRFAIRGTPTFIVLDAKGDEIHRLTGYHTADEFIGVLDGVRKKG